MEANSPSTPADRSHRLARQALCREIADSIALHETLDAVFDTAAKCFALCQANNTLKEDDSITREAFEALESMVSQSGIDGPDGLEIVAALFLLVVSGRFFKQHPLPLMDTWQMVRCMDDEDDERLLSTPAQVQADLLRMLVPPLLSALERMTELQQYHMFNDAAEHVADLCDSPAPQPETLSTRIPSAVQVLCLDFDDTIYIHEHIPEMFDVYEMVQGFMDPLVINDMLSAGAPHRRFLLCLVDSMLASGRDVFIVSFGRDEWVLPAAAAIFGDRIPENHIFTRSNEPNGIEPPDKTTWLWEIAAHCGVPPHQVQLVDDAFTNHRTAVEQGFSSIKVSPHEGLHWGVWRQELMLRALSTCRLTSRLASLAAAGAAPWVAGLAPNAMLPRPSRADTTPRDSEDKPLPRPPPRPETADPVLEQMVDGTIEEVVDELFSVDWHRAASERMEQILATRPEDELELHCVATTNTTTGSTAAPAMVTHHLRSRSVSMDSADGRRAASEAAAAAVAVYGGHGVLPPSPAWGVVEPDALVRMQEHAAVLQADATGAHSRKHSSGSEGAHSRKPSSVLDGSHSRKQSGASDDAHSGTHSASSSLSIAFEQLTTAAGPEDLPPIQEGVDAAEAPVVGEAFAVVRVRASRGWLRGRLRGSPAKKDVLGGGEKGGSKPAPRLGIVGHAKLLRGLLRGKRHAAAA